jgi:hypothetical protein
LGKPYFIDPMTYIFANDPAQLKRFIKDKKTGRTLVDQNGRKMKGDVRRSYSKLVDVHYQGIAKLAVEEDRALSPRDFTQPAATNQFVTQVVAFERNHLAAVPDKYKKYAKYAQSAGKPLSTSANLPMLLVPPYFPTSTFGARGWHQTNVQMIQRTKAQADGIPVFPVLLAETQVLARYVKQIAAEYLEAGADGFLLWPDGFAGDQSPTAISAVFDVVRTLRKLERPVILMYGDAFSLALHYAGLVGFACGICYGEQKLSTQDIDVEGTIPARYYLRGLKKKIVIETEARRIQIDKFPDLKCNCVICQRKPDAATLEDPESREHFMLVRAAELAELRSGLSQSDFVAGLDKAYKLHSNDPLLRPIDHLRNWSTLLSQ